MVTSPPCAAGAEAAFAAVRLVEPSAAPVSRRVSGRKSSWAMRSPTRDGERLVGVGVQEDDAHLAAIARVDEPGSVDDGDAVPGGQAGARQRERRKAGRQAEGDAGADDGARERRERGRLRRVRGRRRRRARRRARAGGPRASAGARGRAGRRQASAAGLLAASSPESVDGLGRAACRSGASGASRLEAEARVAPGLGRGQPGLEDDALGRVLLAHVAGDAAEAVHLAGRGVREEQAHRTQRAVEEAAETLLQRLQAVAACRRR